MDKNCITVKVTDSVPVIRFRGTGSIDYRRSVMVQKVVSWNNHWAIQVIKASVLPIAVHEYPFRIGE